MKIKPCPFCGSYNLRIAEKFSNLPIFVYCSDCHTCGPHTNETETEAIELWNAAFCPDPVVTGAESPSLNDLCTAAVDKWGAPLQVQKAVEELAELQLVLIRWMNGKEPASKIRDNIREEREDVEIMLRQLDVIFGRSKEWQHKKYEHLQAIVEDTEDD